MGDLKPTDDFITISYDNNLLTIIQEYGSQNPDGWLIAYVSFKNKHFVVDSISNQYKSREDEIITETIKIEKEINKINLINEFNNLLKSNLILLKTY